MAQRLKRLLKAILSVVVLWQSPSYAQQLNASDGPANLPPSGYIGTEFVDNRGCIYIRAGSISNPTWVPRVTRDRKQVCGRKPSFNKNISGVASVSTRPSVKPKADFSPLRTVASTSLSEVQTSPNGLQKLSTLPATQQVAASFTSTIVVRKGVGLATIPQGFRPAWDDDRLNLYRGIPKMQGILASEQVWTQDVPRKLRTGERAINLTPVKRVIYYPFRSAEQQEQFINARGALELKVSGSGEITLQPTSQSGRLQFLSTESTNTYIQVGTYGVFQNAQRTLNTLDRLNVPAHSVLKETKNRLHHIVYAGPFSGGQSVQSALLKIRNSGYGDAIIR